MCYSAQIWADYKKYERFGGTLSIKEYTAMAGWTRQKRSWLKVVPKALQDVGLALNPDVDSELFQTVAAAEIEAMVDITDEIEFQTNRHIEAKRKLASPKPTKKAANDLRVSAKKMEAGYRRIEELKAPPSPDGIDRIWPGHFAPVMIRDSETGERLIAPMRYRCRLPGWTEADEIEKPGTYNARRDSFRTAWRKEFGVRHGLIAVHRFYESVKLHDLQQRSLVPGEREQKIEIVFTPQTGEDLFVACLWEHTEATADDPELYSFAVITDHPPPEVAIAGHDRCIVSIREEDFDAWLNPTAHSAAELQAILDRGEAVRPFFEHELSTPELATVD